MKQLYGFLLLVSLALLIGCSSEEDSNVMNESTDSLNNTTDFSADADIIDPTTEGEQYNEYPENQFISVKEEPTSTFSIDADGASYSNAKRYIENGSLPPTEAIRIEEFINYFSYQYPEPTDEHPLAIRTQVGDCPWTEGNKLIQIGLKGKNIPAGDLPPANIVFLIDVSGSMSAANKLPLLKEGFLLLVEEMRPQDKVAIVTYAGSDRVALEATSGNDKQKIINAINNLESGGSTAGAAGITTAYEIAEANFVDAGNNRIILATDGDFNVGPSSQDELVKMVEEKRQNGVFLTVLGFGTGNLNDAMMEQLANNGNGNYEYISSMSEARKVFIQEFGKLYTVAKDVKIQIHFDETVVDSYRLIGYENRLLNNEDFEDDTKDAGELGANQTVTAIYEVTLVPRPSYYNAIPLNVDFRYKLPDEDTSRPMSVDAVDREVKWADCSEDYRFAAATAAFGMLLRESEFAGTTTFDNVIEWAEQARAFDPEGLRAEFVEVVKKAKQL